MKMHTNTYFGRLLAAAMILVLTGCQGSLSEKPPLHFNQNMDFQEKFQAQESNSFFADGRAMREPVRGTVARGFLKDDVAFWTGRNENGSFTENPLTVDLALLERGKDQYEIFCSVCHGIAGDGQGYHHDGRVWVRTGSHVPFGHAARAARWVYLRRPDMGYPQHAGV